MSGEQLSMTPAQVISIVENAERFFTVFQGLALVARNAQAVEGLSAAAVQRQQKAIELADEAEQATKTKLDMYAQKIQRASEEADRILGKANKDANAALETATAHAKELTDTAKKNKEAAVKLENAAKARTAELLRKIEKQEKELAVLQNGIDAANEKIASFQKK